jgi:arginine deiminase
MSEADKLRKILYPKPKNLALTVRGTSTTREFNLYSKNQLNKKMQGVEHIDFTKKLRDEQSQTDAECIARAKLVLHEEAA